MAHYIPVCDLCRAGIVLNALVVMSCERIDHPAGRDTVASFGNGRFQVLYGMQGQSLRDIQIPQATLIYALHEWNRSGDWVYAVGDDTHGLLVYVVLNYRTGFHETFKSVDDASEEYKKPLGKLRPGRKLPGL